jgi:hypothetical protein
MILKCLAEHNPPADGSIRDLLDGSKAAELRQLKKNVLLLMLYSDDFTVGFSSCIVSMVQWLSFVETVERSRSCSIKNTKGARQPARIHCIRLHRQVMLVKIKTTNK